jgi:NhaP-type Na+/H+ or K+/H+ antiporter
VAVLGLGLPLGAGVLLGAILAPTDPVLATAAQVESSGDRDRLRFSLTGEGGLKDGTAFPFVMLPQPADNATASHATDIGHASAYMMQAVRGFNGQMERVSELVVVPAVGAMLPFTRLPASAAGLLVLLFLLIRPVSVWLGLLGAPVSRDRRAMIGWFGIRGIGSIYYLMYAIHQGLPRPLGESIVAITLAAVTVSIVLHGMSVRPIMHFYWKRKVAQDP